MKRYWELVRNRVDGMTLRERALIFAAAGFLTISLVNSLLLDPLLQKQKILSSQVVQQHEKIKELQAAMESLLQARRDDKNSPLRMNIAKLKQQLQEMDGYLLDRSSRLVEPDKMADLLKHVLSRNGGLQLIELKTLPVGLLIGSQLEAMGAQQPAKGESAIDAKNLPASEKQIFKHGVEISVRGSYPDLLRYVAALEKMTAQMYWGEVSLKVEQYPSSVLTLTLFTLSLNEKWLTV